MPRIIPILFISILLFSFGMASTRADDLSKDKSFIIKTDDDKTIPTDKSKEKIEDKTKLLSLEEILPNRVEVRVKDVAHLDGIRKNQLFGIGLVTGLAGTGDDTNSVKFTAQAIANMLDNLGIKAEPGDIRVKNFASVMVTADLPPFTKPGETIDVNISAMGNAKSLEGGTLVLTPLQAANGEIYAVAQGPVTLGGFSAGGTTGAEAKVRKNFLTAGRIPSGAIVEKEVNFEFSDGDSLTWILREPDFTTASLMANSITSSFPLSSAKAIDPSIVTMHIPAVYTNDPASFIARVEQIKILVDSPSKVVINEKNGTIVLGGNVKIMPVSIAHGSITVTISEKIDISQPAPLSGGKTVVTEQTGVTATEKPAQFVQVTSENLVNALNQMGASAKDIVAIFQALKAAGALEAELVLI